MVAPYNTIRINGLLPGGEVWSINPKFGISGGGAVDDYQILLGWASSVAGLNSGNIFPTSWRTALSTAGRIASIRAEYYGADGRLAVAAEYILPTSVAGTGTPNKSFSDAICVSLLSGRPGRSYRGRLYIPGLAVGLDTTALRITPTVTLALATEGAAFLDAIADAVGAGQVVRPIIVSQTLGVNTQVSAVRVGDVLDTQRRRRDSLQEAYNTAPVPV